MAKVNSICGNVQGDVNQNLVKFREKTNQIVLPPIFKPSFSNDGIQVQALMRTQRLNLSKLHISTLKQLNCSKIDNLRYCGDSSVQNNQKTLVRPWAAKNRKLSKENKPEISKIPIKEKSEVIKTRKFSKSQKNEGKSLNFAQFASERSKNYEANQHIRAHNGCLTEREGRFNVRDRMNSCRVATKKTGFPFNKKQYEHSKISEHFERDQEKLSTIPSNVEEQHQKFISFDSYTELVF